MSTAILPAPFVPSRIFDLSNKVTIGGALCITEGITASIMIVVPQNHWYYITITLLTFAIWAAFWRFRENKVGADVGDLFFCELLVHLAALGLYYAGGMNRGLATVYWFCYVIIAALKLWRVYLWQSSATQQYGWRRFGFMTWYHAKYHAAARVATPRHGVGRELALGLVLAVLFAAGIKQFSDIHRVIAMWVLPLTFEFLNGPAQLRGLAMLQSMLMSSTRHADAVQAENAALKSELAQQNQFKNVPAEALAVFAEAYRNVHEEKREHMLEVVQVLAQCYPAPTAQK